MMPIAHFSTGFDDQMGHQKFISQIEPSMPLLFESGKQDVFQIQPEYILVVQDFGRAEISFFMNWQPRIEAVYVSDAQLDHNDRTLLTPIITDSNGDRYEVKWEVPEECGSVDDANAEQVIYTAPAQGEMTCELMLTVTEIRSDDMEPLSSSMPVYIHIGEPVSPF